MSENKHKENKKSIEKGALLGQKKENSEPKTKEEENKELTKEELAVKGRKQNLSFIIFAGILILVFLAIVFVPRYLHQTSIDKNKYNGFDFVKDDEGVWYTVVQKGNQPYQIPFYYHPSELEDIPVDGSIREKFFSIRDNNGSIFITMDPDGNNNTIVIAGVEIAKVTGTRYGLLNVNTHSAFIKKPNNTTVDTSTPVVTCSDANDKIMVIWLTLSNKNIVYSYGNCIILEAASYRDMVRVADRLMYNLLGIMDVNISITQKT
jgi:hypothetical protein